MGDFSSKKVAKFSTVQVKELDAFMQQFEVRTLGGIKMGPILDVSENSGFSPQIIHFKRVFHYKPSILGYPYFWKHPFWEGSNQSMAK